MRLGGWSFRSRSEAAGSVTIRMVWSPLHVDSWAQEAI
jgi:hypothetical protein